MIYNPKRKNYLAQIPYIISQFIYEYDIVKANISILLYKGIISKNEFDYIASLPKGRRNYDLGIMQKDKEISKQLSNGLAEMRERFIVENNITDGELLSVKNDALYLINKEPLTTIFDGVEFIKKNVYNSYFYINKLEIYYYLDIVNDVEVIDIKGINDNNLVKHQYYFIELLCSVFESFQTRTIDYTIQLITDIHRKYISKELDIGFYRELNASSAFRITMKNNNAFLLDTIDSNNIEYLDVNYNLHIIRELFSIASVIYFNKGKTLR